MNGDMSTGMPVGVSRTRTLQRRPPREKWNPNAADMVGGAPLFEAEDKEADGPSSKGGVFAWAAGRIEHRSGHFIDGDEEEHRHRGGRARAVAQGEGGHEGHEQRLQSVE